MASTTTWELSSAWLVCVLNPMLISDAEPVLDLSFLIDYVMEEVKPLRWEEVLASPIPLKIVASCLDQLRPVILEACFSLCCRPS